MLLQEPVTYQPGCYPGMCTGWVRLALNTLRDGRSHVFSNCSNCRATVTPPAVLKGGPGSKRCQAMRTSSLLAFMLPKYTTLETS